MITLQTLQAIEIGAADALLRLAVLLVLVVVIAFFVAAELAIVSASRPQIEQMIHQSEHPGRQKAAKLVQHAQDHLAQYLSVTQTGTTAGSLLLGWIGEGATVRWIEPWISRLPIDQVSAMITSHSISVAIAFLLVTYIEIVLGELVPKVLATHAPEQTALWIIRPLQICSYLFFPALVILNGTVRLLTGWITNRDKIESEPSEGVFVEKDAYSVIVTGSIDLQRVNEKLGFSLPANEAYRSIAGFMIHQLGRMPAQGNRVQWGELELEALRVAENRLETVLLRRVTRPLLSSPVLSEASLTSS